MSDIDIYPLEASKEFYLSSGEEARIDLSLHKKPGKTKNEISGYVTSNRDPVKYATVKILDRAYNPVKHTLTDKTGHYIIKDIPTGYYKITATKPGFLVARTIDFCLQFHEDKKINLKIKEDPTAELGFIYGLVMDYLTGSKIRKAVLKLFTESESEPIAVTESNSDGQYLFGYIAPGRYFLQAFKTDYLESQPVMLELPPGDIQKVDFRLKPLPVNGSGTVSGILKEGAEVLTDVCTGLYRIDGDAGNETLIQVKRTNDEGLYLFSNIDPGKYLIKAKSIKNREI